MERIRSQVAQEALHPRGLGSPNSVISISSDSNSSHSTSMSQLAPRPAVHPRVQKNLIVSDGSENSDDEVVLTDSGPHSTSTSQLAPPSAAHTRVRTSLIVSDGSENSDDEVVFNDTGPPLMSSDPMEPLRSAINGAVMTRPSKSSAPVAIPIQQTTRQPVGIPIPSTIRPPVAIPIPGNARQPVGISIPDNTRPPAASYHQHEIFDLPVNRSFDYEVKKTTAEADKELKELFEGAMEDGPEEIDMSEAMVDGFVEGIVLKPHQVKGRIWMRERETGRKAGGLLCDDMGLGKTIQTVVRIVDGPPSKEDRKNGWSQATLVICPVALVKQWAQEVRKYTGSNLRVVEHYGPSRTSDPDILAKAHVVVTSYNTVSSEHATWLGGAKNESHDAKATKKGFFFGSEAQSDDSESSSNFGKASKKTEYRKAPAKKRGKKLDAIFNVQWWRIVLDEAHNIKNHKTKSSTACCDLNAKYRWALTGTPLQNSVEDLFSLFKFLRVRPLNDWTHFNDVIAKPVKSGRTTRAMRRLQVVMKAIMLRRLKDMMHEGAPLVQLPPRTLEIVECDFDDDEKAFYSSLEARTTETMNKFVKQNELMGKYAEVMVLLLRLRQACNHPILVSKDFQNDIDALDSKPAGRNHHFGDDDDDGLADLFQKMDVNATKRCNVCRTELDKHSASDTSKSRCEQCECQIAFQRSRKSFAASSDLPPSSAKIRKIMELLEHIDKRTNGQEKTIIFSQFTSMLDLIELFLRDQGIQYVRYDGSMNAKQREVSLEKIRESVSIRVILISFKAGGAGLNLTACNNVILVDLWWNPALEEQAFGRVHRYGQERDVMIYKLTVEQTVEQRILALQETKRQLANAALSGDKLQNNKLGMEEILALFKQGGHEDLDSDND